MLSIPVYSPWHTTTAVLTTTPCDNCFTIVAGNYKLSQAIVANNYNCFTIVIVLQLLQLQKVVVIFWSCLPGQAKRQDGAQQLFKLPIG